MLQLLLDMKIRVNRKAQKKKREVLSMLNLIIFNYNNSIAYNYSMFNRKQKNYDAETVSYFEAKNTIK